MADIKAFQIAKVIKTVVLLEEYTFIFENFDKDIKAIHKRKYPGCRAKWKVLELDTKRPIHRSKN